MRKKQGAAGKIVRLVAAAALAVGLIPSAAFAADEAPEAAAEAAVVQSVDDEAAQAEEAQDVQAADQSTDQAADESTQSAEVGETALAPMTNDDEGTTGTSYPKGDFSQATVTLPAKSYAYDGKDHMPAASKITVTMPDHSVLTTSDFTFVVKKNGKKVATCVKAGTFTVEVSPAGTYVDKWEGVATATFTITESKPTLTYSASQGNKGKKFADYVKEGKTSGKTSKKNMQGISIKVSDSKYDGNIKYKVQFQNKGWTDYAKNGKKIAKNANIQAIQIKLTDELKENYDVYYRVYVQVYGWMGWAKNDQKAGTTGMGMKVRAYQVKLVKKGGDAPGSTKIHGLSYQSDTDSDYETFAKKIFEKKCKSKSSNTKYLIVTSTHLNRTAIYTGKKGKWKLKYWWLCTTGKDSSPTVTGNYKLGIKGNNFTTSDGNGTCWWYSQIKGNYLYHSVIYKLGSKTKLKSKNQLAHNKSHGCVRLELKNAKWIYDNVPGGTKIYIFKDA